jgi:hypothetical protein
LLTAVGRIVGHVQVDRHLPQPASEARAMSPNNPIEQRRRHPIQVSRPERILEPRQSRLRSQVIAIDGIPIDQRLVYRVGCQARRVVTIRIAAGQRKDALAEQLGYFMDDLVLIATINDAIGKSVNQAKSAIRGLQQDGAAVRAAVVDVEAGHKALSEKVGEQTLCRGRLGHVKAFCVVGRLCRNAFLPRGGFSFVRFRE